MLGLLTTSHYKTYFEKISLSIFISNYSINSVYFVYNRNSDIRLPWFLSSDSQLNIYISDRNAQCIKVGCSIIKYLMP